MAQFAAMVSHGYVWLPLLCLALFLANADAYVGFNYGTNGDNFPPPATAVQLLKNLGISQVRIYDTNASVLTAFQNSNIQLTVGILNDELESIGTSNVSASTWVTTKLVPFKDSTNIYAIAVGNEVLTGVPSLSSFLVPAMQNVMAALSANNLGGIKVSSPCSMDVLSSTYPPSTGTFNASYTAITQMLDFLTQTNSFFMLNVYPWKAYAANIATISLDYALFNSTSGVLDNTTGFLYTNLFDSQIDATYAALAKHNKTELSIVVSETGWPTAGQPGEAGASTLNAQTFVGNLVKHVTNKTGTPARTGLINTYLYELYSENRNVGPESQRNYGLFNNDSTPLYVVNLSGSNVTDGSGNGPQTWCIAKQGVSEVILQSAIDFACGVGNANCSEIQYNASCYLPNTRYSHASFAMNQYYVMSNTGSVACNFQGAAQITVTDPSYGTCKYPSSTSTPIGSGHSLMPMPASVQFTLAIVVMALIMNLRH